MRLRARDYFTSSTLIGGIGRARPSSLHTLVGMQAPHDSVARQAGPTVWEILTLTPGVAKNLLKEGKKTEKALGSRGPV